MSPRWPGWTAARRQSRAALLAGACTVVCAAGCGPSWPTPRSVADPAFLAGAQPVASVDLLPIDLQVWTGEGSEREPGELYHALDAGVGGAVAAELAGRGYQVRAQLGWDGRYVAPDGVVRAAMSEEDLASTAWALSGYGEAQRRVRDGILAPFLPARLGGATGSDATLYVGGWAFAGKDGGSTAGKVAKGVLVVALVAAVVVIAVAAAKKSGGGGGGALGSAARSAGRVASGAARVAGRVLVPAGRLARRAALATLRSGPDMLEASLHVLDAMGRSSTHLAIYPGRPDHHRSGPRKGRSAMQLEMTLIDNRTGQVLWHARERFPARPERPADVQRAVRRLLAGLPAAG